METWLNVNNTLSVIFLVLYVAGKFSVKKGELPDWLQEIGGFLVIVLFASWPLYAIINIWS